MEFENLKKLTYKVIKEFGILKDHNSSIKYINWLDENIYLILWCDKYLMWCSHQEKFNILHGLSDLKDKESLGKFLNKIAS